MRPAVLDASAALALLFAEPGGERVQPWLAQATMGSVNVAEVLGKLIERGQNSAHAWKLFSLLALPVAAFDGELARGTAQLGPLTRRQGLSLGDRACLALARKLGLPAVTADRRWARLEIGVEIQLVR